MIVKLGEAIKIISKEEIKEKINVQPPEVIDKIETELDRESEEMEKYLNNKAKIDVIRLRKWWGYVILGCVVAIVIFDFKIILLLGYGKISFSEGYIVPIFITESLLKIIGLAIIIVGYLFNKDKKE